MTFEEYCYSVCPDRFVSYVYTTKVYYFKDGCGEVVADLTDLNQLACVVEALIRDIQNAENINKFFNIFRESETIKQAFIDFIEATRTDQCLEDYKDE